MFESYPVNWHRKLDFLPPLGLQVAVGEADLELYYCYASVSIQEAEAPRIPREARTAFGTLKVSPTFRNQVDYVMGRDNPRNGINPVSQREILYDITNNIGGAVRILGNVPDVEIKSRGVVEKIPRELESLSPFQGSEDVYYHQDAYGNFIHRMRRATGIYALENPYRFMKNDLILSGIVRTANDPVLRKIRSTLKTQWVITDASGWSDLGDTGILTLEQSLLQKRWYADIGRPTGFQIPYDSMQAQGQVYRLLRRNCLVAV